MKKHMCVVWVINNNHVLMGKQAPGKKLAGFRIGFGGKCNEGESTVECAQREVKEELGKDFTPDQYVKAGTVTIQDKVVDFYAAHVPTYFKEPEDNDEFVDVRWIPLSKIKDYIPEMLDGDEVIVCGMLGYLDTGKEFEIVKKETGLLKEQTKNIYK